MGAVVLDSFRMRREPVTWSRSDRIVYYRRDATRLCNMAETETRSPVRDQLARLAQQYHRIADAISKAVREA